MPPIYRLRTPIEIKSAFTGTRGLDVEKYKNLMRCINDFNEEDDCDNTPSSHLLDFDWI